MGRRVIALIAAGLVAIFGVIATVVYANGADRRAIANSQPQKVYITAKVVPVGTTLQSALDEQLILETVVAAKSKPIGALTDIPEDLRTKVALTDIGIGEYVLASRFGETPSAQSVLPVPAGMVAVSVLFTAPEGVNRFPTPGSHLVIFSTYEVKTATIGPGGGVSVDPGAEGSKETRILLEDVVVLGVDSTSFVPAPTADKPAREAVSGDSVIFTVAVNADDATRLVQGIRATALYAGLRGGPNGEGVKTDPIYRVSMQNLFEKR